MCAVVAIFLFSVFWLSTICCFRHLFLSDYIVVALEIVFSSSSLSTQQLGDRGFEFAYVFCVTIWFAIYDCDGELFLYQMVNKKGDLFSLNLNFFNIGIIKNMCHIVFMNYFNVFYLIEERKFMQKNFF